MTPASWRPHVAGALVGVLAIVSVLVSTELLGKPQYLGASTTFVRAAGAFLGGVVAMFGARLAGGCPSGHGLSGLMQLSVSGFLAMAGFFGAGVLVARLVYRKGGEG